jgi:hypothetical protein
VSSEGLVRVRRGDGSSFLAVVVRRNPRNYDIFTDDPEAPGPFCDAPAPPPYDTKHLMKCRRQPRHPGEHAALSSRGRVSGGVRWAERFVILW